MTRQQRMTNLAIHGWMRHRNVDLVRPARFEIMVFKRLTVPYLGFCLIDDFRRNGVCKPITGYLGA